MCGACPGGAAVSRISAYAALAGIKQEVAGLLQRAAGPRLTIRAFGNGWTVRDRLGRQRVLPGLEEVAAAVAAGPLDWAAVSALTGQTITGRAPRLTCEATTELGRVAARPLAGPATSAGSAGQGQPVPLTAGGFTAALLIRAANARAETDDSAGTVA